MTRHAFLLAVVAACAGNEDAVAITLDRDEVSATFSVDGTREVQLVVGDAAIVEAWADGAVFTDVDTAQLTAGASASWLAPRTATGELVIALQGSGDVTLTAWRRGAPAAPVTRDRSLAWLDGALLDDTSLVSFARVLAAISDDGHGGALLDRWFRAFAAGPGAGRATFAQFLAEVANTHGSDPRAWNLAALPFRVTGVHNRIDLATDGHCGELRVSVASTHATFSPVHLIFLFRQAARADDVTPDDFVHCRGTARRWANVADLTDMHAILDETLVRDRFVMAESVELSLSPWQWRQWLLDDAGRWTNPPLFQTVDIARVNTPGPTRDAFLAAVAANAPAITARTWSVPAAFRASVAEVQPNAKAPLPDVGSEDPELGRALGMIGCPRCHTDDADFIHTGIDRRPSPFYDKELDARAARLDALVRGEWPAAPPFGPLQP